MRDPRNGPDFALASRSLPLIGLCVAVGALIFLVWYLIDVLLLAFAGALLAIVLRTPAEWLARHTGLDPRLALIVVLALLAGTVGAAGWLFGQVLVTQITELWTHLPQIVEKVRSKLYDFNWLIGQFNPKELISGGSAVGRGIDVIRSTFGAVAYLVIVFFTAVFFAWQPRLYIGGLLALVPTARRKRAGQIVATVGHTLRWWLIGQLILMATIALITGIGLWILGVPFVFALALIAGLLEFIPYLGPIMAAVPAVLVALAKDPMLAVYVVLLYIGIQSFEGHILQPVVQRKTVYLPPAVVLLSQLVLGILVGVLGIMVATPLAASVLVIVNMLYVEDLLGEKPARVVRDRSR